MTQKSKNITLVFVLILMFVSAYYFGVSKTVEISKQLSVLEARKALHQSAPKQLTLLEAKEKALNKVLQKNNLSGVSLQNHLLEVLNKETNTTDLKITSFKKPHAYFNTNLKSTTTTYQFGLSGSYNTIINTIYNLEQNYNFGNVVHLDFEVEKYHASKKKKLNCTIMLQRVH